MAPRSVPESNFDNRTRLQEPAMEAHQALELEGHYRAQKAGLIAPVC